MILRLLLIAVFAVAVNTPARADMLEPIHRIELGAFGGAMLISPAHELYDEDVNVWRELEDAPEVGIRFGYLPWSFIGAEFEAAYMPTDTVDGVHANVYAIRAHLLGQYPWIVTPFLVAGGGFLGIASSNTSLGDDIDGKFYWGAGLKYDVLEWLGVRFDFRHDITNRYQAGGLASHFELLAGVSFRLFQVDPDRDEDGFVDKVDACPDQPAPNSENGCPPPPDRDGDGFADDVDKCPDVPGTIEGCPPDTDGDGVLDPDDKCPQEPGPAPDGCPLDTDGDGILDADDKCPKEPETVNQFEDEDGCPDEVPHAIKTFHGTIGGITFALSKADIRPSSRPALDKAAKTMTDYPHLKVLIRGHTDSTGSARFNETLSKKRADSVRTYLIGKGIDGTRITTEGVGPAEPIADNKTRAGREKNRRIEFVPATD